MKLLSILILCLVSLKSISAHPNKRSVAFRAVRKCAGQHGLDMKTVTSLVRGDFSSDTKDTKCFLKCVAHELQFWQEEKPQKSNMLQYIDLLVKKTDGVSEIIDNCIAADVSEDFCEHLYNVYKCFWADAMIQPDQKAHDNDDFHLININENELKKN